MARPIAESYIRDDLPIEFIPSDSNIAESVLLGCNNGTAPFVITNADNVLIKHDSIGSVIDALTLGADAVAALANKNDNRAIHPLAQRGFYEFRDNGYPIHRFWMRVRSTVSSGPGSSEPLSFDKVRPSEPAPVPE